MNLLHLVFLMSVVVFSWVHGQCELMELYEVATSFSSPLDYCLVDCLCANVDLVVL